MRYSLFALIALMLITGCAHKQRVQSTPGTHRYKGCREISINAKTGETTVICPPQEVTK